MPWLHIADVVAAEAAARGFRKLGLTGTRWLVESQVYPEKLAARGIELLRRTRGARGHQPFHQGGTGPGCSQPEAVACFQRIMGR